MNNRKWNIRNPYQGTAKRVLCVCSAGLLRSPTAANVLHAKFGYNTRACGVDVSHALIPVDEVLVEWADEIVCMGREHSNIIRSQWPEQSHKLKVLGIPDSYSWNDEELKELILFNYVESNNESIGVA